MFAESAEDNSAGQVRGDHSRKSLRWGIPEQKLVMRFTALQDPCGQWMVYDLLSDLPARMPDILLLGLTREEAERIARQANEFLPQSQPRAPRRSALIGNLGGLKRQAAPVRFMAVRDPCDDWLVCDLVSDLPAELENRLLIGLARSDAERLAGLANAGIISCAGNSPVPAARAISGKV
ncbi:hypothetical protein [Mesorhizobium sp. GbtcB19]|uniref:hypothetical protein n=1 Tax=Mesorhizobium sp. GbtcB19 TaxID=2824764 RepID=UPI001C30E57F|nr:hypothetical protein [Mesorhizobium sp. GbtcB19]